MTDSTGSLPEVHTSEPTETQLAQAGDAVVVGEPQVGTSIQLVAPGDSLQLNFDPADVAKAEVKDGNLEITFDNGSVAVVQGYEQWAAAGGQPTGPQGGAVDVAQLGQSDSAAAAAPDQPPACEVPGENVHVVEVPVPSAGERVSLAVAPGDALRLACSFRDVSGQEVGDSLEMTFPGGGVVVVENFSAWIAAQGATITDCVCGGVNPADFIVALGLNPEDVLPAAGDSGGPQDNQGNDLGGSGFTPGPGPEILTGLPYPHILPPTGLLYGVPEPEQTFFPVDEESDLGGPQAQDDPPDAIKDILTVVESTVGAPIGNVLALAMDGGEGGQGGEGGCLPPIGPQIFQTDSTTFQVLTNDTFGPDGGGDPPITAFHFNGDPSLVDNADGVLVLDPAGDKLVITSSSLDPNADRWHAEMIINGPNAGQFTFFLDSTFTHEDGQGVNHAFQSFSYTIQDSDGDTASANVTVDIVDSVPVANNDCEICFVEPGVDAEVITPVTGNVMANDDLGADQFLPDGTKLISFTYDDGAESADVPDGGFTTVTTAIGGTLTVHSNGDWSYTPPANVDNSNGDVHDDFGYTIRDGDGDTDSAVQPICIQDGAEPEAFDNKQCVNEGATQNVMIIADVSGSMDDNDLDPGPGVITRLDLEKAALTALVNQYAALEGTVTVTVIAFASGAGANEAGGDDTNGARNLGTFTFSSTTDQGYLDAVAAINSLAIGMDGLDTETEYDDALILAQDILAGQIAGQPDGTTNTVYFLSDGVPNPLSNGADATDWKNFVNANGVEVVAIGMGNDVTTAELDKVEDNDDKSIIVNDAGDLSGLLTNVAGNASVSGNVLLDPTEEADISPANDPVGSVDDFGSDGPGAPKILSLTQGSDTFTPGSAVGGDVVSNDGTTIVIHTDLGGLLSFNFETGAYTYTAPDQVDQGDQKDVDERFTYVIQDTDGDTDPADLVICIKDNVEPPTVTMAIGVDGNGACVEEDSLVNDPDNRVDVHAAAQNDDTLTQLVITGFDQGPDWEFNFDGMTQPGVTGVVYDPVAGTVTVTFGPDVKTFDGSFGVQPPPDSDVDLGTLTATATAAAAGDPTDTLDSSTNLNVTVDANADAVDVTAFAVSDTGGDGSFSPNETGTLHIAATFGDSQDGSETHTVTVEVPAAFDVTDSAGGLVTDNPDGSHTITFNLDTAGGSNDFSADVGIQATNGIAPEDYEFSATATATETTTGDTECDTSPEDNIATDTASDTVQGADDQPIAYDNKQCVNEGASANVMIIADVSGSMDDDDISPLPGNQTRLDLEKASLVSLVDKYAALDGTITLTLIAFASGGAGAQNAPGGTDVNGARNLGTFTFDGPADPGYAAAIAAINSLAIGMQGLATETEYDDALILAQNLLTTQLAGQTDGETNTVYFLSDGLPNPLSNGAGATGWKVFVDANNVAVVAVGIGNDVTTAELDKAEDHSDKSVIVDDQGDLAGLLTNIAGNSSVSGNVLIDPTEEPNISPANDPVGSVDDFGDNGAGAPKIISLVHDGHTYDLSDVVGGEGGTVLAKNGNQITIQTDLGGTLTFNFETGDYTYVAPDKVQHGPPGSATDTEVDEVFTYTIQDTDGDTDPADLVICIQDGVPTAFGDVNLVQESALDLNKDGIDLAAGLVTGSNPGSTAETVTGNLIGNDSEGPDGATITAVGGVTTIVGGFITVDTGHSVLKVNVVTGDYTYTLTDNTDGDNAKDTFNYTLTDGDGDTSSADLVVTIVDDVPNAIDDVDSIPSGQFGPALGNVITDAEGDGGKDTVGADNALVSSVSSNNIGGSDSTADAGNFQLDGQYGKLTINENGTYSYTRNAGTPGGVQDVFTYTLKDGDGDTDKATLTINIGDNVPTVDVPTAGEAGTQVFEKGLPARGGEPEGSGEAADPGVNSDKSETTAGQITFTQGDAPATVSIGGVVVDSAGDTVQGAFGVLTVTGIDGDSVEYSYTLSDNTTGDTTKDTFAVQIADKDGDKANGSLVIDIVDDVPDAINDVDSIPSGQFGPAVGNVITDAEGDGGKDTVGADNALVSLVSSNNVPANSDGTVDGGKNFQVDGEYGKLTINENGTYSYTRNAGTPGGVQDVFTYTLKDGDGDTDKATLTINIGDDTPTVDVPTAGEAGTQVFEKGLPARGGEPEGSGEAADPGVNSDKSETTAGQITFTQGDAPATVSIGGVVVDSAGDTVQGAFGVLTVTGIDGDSVEYSYTLSDNTTGDTTKDTFAVQIADKDGDKANGSLVIDIVDDVPDAINDVDSIPSGQFGPAVGNVITDAEGDGGKDTVGADNALVSSVSSNNIGGSDSTADAGNFQLDGQYGKLTINENGTYSYTRNAGTPGGVQDVFTYTLKDGDGDTDKATLTINIGDNVPTVDVPTAGEAGTQVFEKGLPARGGEPEGSGEAADPGVNSDKSETTSGQITFTQGDAPATVSIGGVVVDSAGDTVQGAFGVLTVTGIDGDSIEYSYTLSDNTVGDTTKDTFAIEIADKDGDKAPGNLVIDIVDDVPIANNDKDSVGAGGIATGNVITGVSTSTDGTGDDLVGADNATVTDIDFGGNDGTPGVGIAGNFGTLTIGADGTYSYQAKANVSGTDVFTYTLTDGDGDSKTATLTIDVGGSAPSVSPDTKTVNEAALDLNKDGADLAGGTTTGSTPALTTETVTGKLVFSDPDGASITKLTFNGADFTDAGDGSADGKITVNTPLGILAVTAATGDYTYTLETNSLKHTTQGTGVDAVNESFGYTVTDGLGNTASSSLLINVQDDVPTANNDKDSVGAGGKATGNVITGDSTSTDGAGDDILGADGATVTDIDFGPTDGTPGVGIAGNFGTLIINANGTYDYQAKANVSGTDVFTYTLTDGDGDTKTATLTIDVLDSKPVVNPAIDEVHEASLDLTKAGQDLVAGKVVGSNPADADETETGKLIFSDPDTPATITKLTFNGGDFTDAGDGATDGFINVDTGHGKLNVNATTGDYIYTLYDKTAGDNVHDDFGYTVTDKLGNTNSSTLTVNIVDDAPTANPNAQSTADAEPQDINLVIVFDRSGSMSEDPGAPGYSTRLELAKAAVAALFEAYQSIAGDLHIKIVDFASDANHTVWLDSVEEANAYLASLEPDGTTHYFDAVQELINNYSDDNGAPDPVPTADRTEVYFISDGVPNPASQSLAANLGAVAQWEGFLTANNIENAYAIGVGEGLTVNDPDLGDISFPNGGGTEPNRIIVTNESELLATLVDTVGTQISGNVLTDPTADVFGADGKGNGGVGLLSIVVGAVTYTYNQATNQITNNAALPVILGAELIVNPPTIGGELHFHFDTGAYQLIPDDVTGTQVENFKYTIIDGDGDTSFANLTLTVTDAGGTVVTPLTHIGTDGNDNFNDSAAAKDIIISGGDGNDTLVGGAFNDHIQGGSGADSISGGGGIDIISGGTGDDTLTGGAGADLLVGGAGADTIFVGTGDSAESGENSGAGLFGNDLIVLQDTVGFAHVDGGFATNSDLSGATTRGDILAFDGDLNLTTLANSKIEGIETISMTQAQGGSADTTDVLTLNAGDVIDLGTGNFNPSGSFDPAGTVNFGTLDTKDTIKVDGEASDTVNLSGGGWFLVGAADTRGGPTGYNLYVHDGGGSAEDAYVLVQNVVAVTGAS